MRWREGGKSVGRGWRKAHCENQAYAGSRGGFALHGIVAGTNALTMEPRVKKNSPLGPTCSIPRVIISSKLARAWAPANHGPRTVSAQPATPAVSRMVGRAPTTTQVGSPPECTVESFGFPFGRVPGRVSRGMVVVDLGSCGAENSGTSFGP